LADQPDSLLDVALSCLDRLEELRALLAEVEET